MAAKKSKTQINQEIQSLDKTAQQQQQIDILKRPRITPTDEDTRQRIAKLFVIVYFILLGLLILGVPIYNLIAFHITKSDKSLQISLTDIIQTYSAVVGPTLGFVIAYYFKSKNDQ